MAVSHSRLFLHKRLYRSGVTLLELVVVTFIIGVVGVGIATLSKDVFSFNRYFNNAFSSGDKAQRLLRPMAEEIRSAGQSNIGAYAIQTATANNFIFYSDINNDTLIDRVRYYLSGTSLIKEVTAPTGNPLVFNDANKVTTTLITNVQNTSQGAVPVFNYYDSSYTGGTTGEVSSTSGLVTDIRLVRVTLYIDADLNMPPPPTIVTTLISVRNLKQQL
jgi:hypothetical protein